MSHCPICSSPLIGKDEFYSDVYLYNCFRCGKYKISRSDKLRIVKGSIKLSESEIANISGWIRENQGLEIVLTKEKLNSLKKLKTLTVSELLEMNFQSHPQVV